MLRLPKRLYEEIIAHGRRAYPKEACGIVAGPVGEEDHVVVQVYPMSNVEDSPIGYAMDPREQLSVEQSMRQRRQRMVGIYHSHTATEAYPSSVDVSLAISPDVSYVLVSLRTDVVRLQRIPALIRHFLGLFFRPQVRSYRIDGTRITLEDVMVGTS